MSRYSTLSSLQIAACNKRMLLPFAIAFGLLGFSTGVCQVSMKKSDTNPFRGPADPVQIHQLFLARVANATPQKPFTFQNDLTDAEMAILNNVAADCDSQLQPLNDSPVVLEARMRFVESGEEQEDWLSRRLAELKARRDRVIIEHVGALRTSLGAPRFQVLETSIQSWYKSLIVVSAIGTGAVPVKKQ
jgi:hypothetical protein